MVDSRERLLRSHRLQSMAVRTKQMSRTLPFGSTVPWWLEVCHQQGAAPARRTSILPPHHIWPPLALQPRDIAIRHLSLRYITLLRPGSRTNLADLPRRSDYRSNRRCSFVECPECRRGAGANDVAVQCNLQMSCRLLRPELNSMTRLPCGPRLRIVVGSAEWNTGVGSEENQPVS